MDQSDSAQWFNQSMQHFADNILNAARLAALKNIQNVCRKGIQETPVTPETMTELITVMVSAIAVTAPASASEEALHTMDFLSKFFALASETWNAAAQQQGQQTPENMSRFEISETIRKQLNDLL